MLQPAAGPRLFNQRSHKKRLNIQIDNVQDASAKRQRGSASSPAARRRSTVAALAAVAVGLMVASWAMYSDMPQERSCWVENRCVHGLCSASERDFRGMRASRAARGATAHSVLLQHTARSSNAKGIDGGPHKRLTLIMGIVLFTK